MLSFTYRPLFPPGPQDCTLRLRSNMGSAAACPTTTTRAMAVVCTRLCCSLGVQPTMHQTMGRVFHRGAPHGPMAPVGAKIIENIAQSLDFCVWVVDAAYVDTVCSSMQWTDPVTDTTRNIASRCSSSWLRHAPSLIGA